MGTKYLRRLGMKLTHNTSSHCHRDDGHVLICCHWNEVVLNGKEIDARLCLGGGHPGIWPISTSRIKYCFLIKVICVYTNTTIMQVWLGPRTTVTERRKKKIKRNLKTCHASSAPKPPRWKTSETRLPQFECWSGNALGIVLWRTHPFTPRGAR